jgi:hypothetical protein
VIAVSAVFRLTMAMLDSEIAGDFGQFPPPLEEVQNEPVPVFPVGAQFDPVL